MSTYQEERGRRELDSELAWLGPPTRESRGLSDREVLLRDRRTLFAANKVNGEHWLYLVEFYRRRLATEKQRLDASPHFALTAREETVVEIGELRGIDPWRLRKDLNVAIFLCRHAPELWDMCLAGQLDAYRVTVVVDTCRKSFSLPDDIAAFMQRMTTYLRRCVRGVDGEPEAEEIVVCTVKQLRNKAAYESRRIRPQSDEFARRYADRGVSVRTEEDGMGSLSINSSVDKVTIADRRLTLAARRQRAQGDERTIQQLKSDLAIDLIAGTADGVPLPAYARPVINLTIPVQTVMGLSDDPGELSGGQVVPAALGRMIAQRPGATWHRMLTDEAGHMVELSTTSYKPTGAIWQHVVAEYPTCFRPCCDAPSTEDDLDHRVAWPLGPTDTANLWPGCRTDHRTKHAPGFAIEQSADGRYMLRTAAGFRHPIDRSPHPVSESFDVPDLAPVDGFQFSASEFAHAIGYLREVDADLHPIPPEQHWEDGFLDALDEGACEAVFAAH